MPPVIAPGKILVTGVNGFLGAHIARDLLKRGFSVVGTVRSPAKGEEISRYFSQYGEKFSYTTVKELDQPGAFDEIISTGKFDGVAHTAAPVPSGQSIVSVGSLMGARVHSPTVKRVVYTSGGLAASQPDPNTKYLLPKAHWNDSLVKLVEEKGDTATDFERYGASKAVSEKAAWNYVADNKDEIDFDLVTVLPTAVCA
ncbi:GRE2-methylglyoxal reductase (NADPH-dependent), related protein [Rhizoctonia solani 123E]|uniref:GRE2-methylglyoxal reductase (NADPH-dependent), related protein n=1 Tax=Rhizoctonia solani 123E TaxID=1423351 RepID=A0A074RQI9_9AGAM|nr:GRE2-methylglyoxal reductase (NADPH-dependent), related protein [Rhizoctonia solani 123E]